MCEYHSSLNKKFCYFFVNVKDNKIVLNTCYSCLWIMNFKLLPTLLLNQTSLSAISTMHKRQQNPTARFYANQTFPIPFPGIICVGIRFSGSCACPFTHLNQEKVSESSSSSVKQNHYIFYYYCSGKPHVLLLLIHPSTSLLVRLFFFVSLKLSLTSKFNTETFFSLLLPLCFR